MPKRVLLAGLFHETHTFLEGITPWAAWQVRRGDELLATEGDGSPLGAVVEFGRRNTWQLLPTIDVRANPSATAADEVVERFWGELRRRAEPELAAGVDGIYLVLHGAMCSQSFPDVEGEILERLSRLPGVPGVPICGVLDLHCNFTPRMAHYSHGLVAYRKNPHTDAAEAAVDGARLLDKVMKSPRLTAQLSTMMAQPPVMWPPTGVATADDPMRTLEALARELEAADDDIWAINVFAGFAFADTHDTGVSFSAVTTNPNRASAALRRLSDWAVAHRDQGNVLNLPIEEVMPRVLAHREGPVILVEPSDNIGGGAPGDCTGILRALLQHRVDNAAVVITDPAAARQCHAARPGARLKLPIGGKSSPLSGGPVELEVEVLSTSDGRFDLEDRHSHLASMHGVHIDMGPSAVVRHGGPGRNGIRILLTTRKTPPFDLGQLRSQGIVPEELFVIGVKAAVAHRRAYDPIAKASYTVETPGPCSSDLRTFPYRHIRRPIFPLDEV
jgi:microcystin degradation protein MlrC